MSARRVFQRPSDKARIQHLHEERKRFRSNNNHSAVTKWGYAQDWRLFEGWCTAEGFASLPASADTLALFVTDQLVSGKKITTVRRRLSAITSAHRIANLNLEGRIEVLQILNGAQRMRHETPEQVAVLSMAQIEKIARSFCGLEEASAARNRAIMLFGFASALRRSTLCALMLGDVEFVPKGMIVHIRFEKQDQSGKGRMIGLPYGARELTCPVVALRRWLSYRGGVEGPLFTRLDYTCPGGKLGPPAIAYVVKKCVSEIGLDPRRYSGHSMRAAFITAAGEAGCSELVIAHHTGHKSMEVLRRYFRRTELFNVNAAGALGL